MLKLFRDRSVQIVSIGLVLSLLTLIIGTACCPRGEAMAAATDVTRTFVSPQEAGDALFKAARSGDPTALLQIFGPDGEDALFSGDLATDQAALEDFAAAYQKMHRWGGIDAGGQMLYLGADNFQFPIPLEKNDSGQWYFDTGEGTDEILARRIGRNELVTIAALGALANAEHQYFSQQQDGQSGQRYASKFVSDEGQRNGLYWPAAAGETRSPVGQMGDLATAFGAGTQNNTQCFGGYIFRILTKQGGDDFAILAYPTEYRNSGIMSFVVGADGVVYQKDLGEKTSQIAPGIMEYNPGDSWELVNP
jgi:hypothetical protein